MNEYSIIEQFVKNTHAETHSSYTLDIKDVFKVSRTGEDKRFKPFKKLHNRKLLWHGSRTTNFAAILSQVSSNSQNLIIYIFKCIINFIFRVFVLHPKKLQLQVTCLVKVYILLTWYPNRPIIVWLRTAIIQVYCFCVKLHWEICMYYVL